MPLRRYILISLAIISLCATCRIDHYTGPQYKTRHVIVVVVDGPRWTETWGDTAHTYIPFRSSRLSDEGTMFSVFRNNGNTTTTSGHAAICTGHYETLNNAGYELPTQPSFFQYWRKVTGKPQEKAWVVASKDKLNVLTNCTDSDWHNQYMPLYDCGVNGPFTGYRTDSVTYLRVISTLTTYHPDLMLVNFAEPDYAGHANDWPRYTSGIYSTDQYIRQIWDFIQADPYYANTTTLIVTNDHGRHLDGHLDGFVSHGDACEGCRHIECIIAGPDTKRGNISEVNRSQIDISRTIAELMGFPMETSEGSVMREAFR